MTPDLPPGGATPLRFGPTPPGEPSLERDGRHPGLRGSARPREDGVDPRTPAQAGVGSPLCRGSWLESAGGSPVTTSRWLTPRQTR